MTIRIKQKYHHYEKWEDFKQGMYKLVSRRNNNDLIKGARLLLMNESKLYAAMKHVAFEWSFASDQNMTNRNRNRQAWLGQAACCYSTGATEDMTKQAWHLLSEKEKNRANAVADKIILEWEEHYKLMENKQKCLNFIWK
jgi:hypothetical protein